MASSMNRADQAEGLRQMFAGASLQVLPVFGAAERIAACVHLAAAAAAEGRGVVILDASAGEIAGSMGLSARYELKHLLQGEKTFDEVALTLPSGVRVLPALRGLASLAQAGGRGDALFGAFGRLSHHIDLVMLNAPAAGVAGVLPAVAGEALIALSPAADSLTQGFACMKQLVREQGVSRFRTLVLHADDAEGRLIHDRFVAASAGRLQVALSYGGSVPRDPGLRQAQSACKTIFDIDPGAAAARAFQRIVSTVAGWPLASVSVDNTALAA